LFFEEVRAGSFQLVVSPVVETEMRDAPGEVQQMFAEMLSLAEGISVTEDALQLQQAYLRAGIVAPRWEADLLHVALATVAGCLKEKAAYWRSQNEGMFDHQRRLREQQMKKSA
jgi:hypothetical protein